jgi:NADH-quinone oxidoreductase subunit N
MVAAAGLVASVVAAFYYLRILKLMWFDAPLDEVALDAAPAEAKTIAFACAAFAFPVVIVGLIFLEPLTRAAAVGFGAG